MQIQWYPGHMHKAKKQIAATLPKVDLIIEILDARIPFSSENPMLASLRRNKQCIKILNKNDLADPAITQLWQTYLEQQRGVKTLALSATEPEKIRRLPDLCHKMAAAKRRSVKDIQAMIIGIPNVGKSTLINTLVGKTIAQTGNEPAVTRAQQRIALPNGITLLDTPGLLWPNLENKNSGYRLAAVGSIKDTALDHSDVAFFAAAYLLQAYPENLRTRYAIEEFPASELELLESVGAKRGCLRAGGQVDLNKVSKLLLNELRSSALGRVSLETPAMMEKELVELASIRKKKAEAQKKKKG
ncbi:MAG: ribosome biogenesis GTPase YlqF [Pseudomonadales bacterium]